MANPKGNPQNLRPGGTVGNKGGPGRLPSELRAACREGFAQGLAAAFKLANGESVTKDGSAPDNSDVLRSIDILGKYGMGEASAVMEDQLAEAAARVFAKYVPVDKIGEAVDALVQELKGA